MNSIQTACKTISNLVDRATIEKTVGLQDGGGSINVQVHMHRQADKQAASGGKGRVG